MAYTYAQQKLAEANQAYEDEVASVAAGLIESGQCSPWNARVRAGEIVRDKRAGRPSIIPMTAR